MSFSPLTDIPMTPMTAITRDPGDSSPNPLKMRAK
jgi:hypothetical protein